MGWDEVRREESEQREQRRVALAEKLLSDMSEEEQAQLSHLAKLFYAKSCGKMNDAEWEKFVLEVQSSSSAFYEPLHKFVMDYVGHGFGLERAYATALMVLAQVTGELILRPGGNARRSLLLFIGMLWATLGPDETNQKI